MSLPMIEVIQQQKQHKPETLSQHREFLEHGHAPLINNVPEDYVQQTIRVNDHPRGVQDDIDRYVITEFEIVKTGFIQTAKGLCNTLATTLNQRQQQADDTKVQLESTEQYIGSDKGTPWPKLFVYSVVLLSTIIILTSNLYQTLGDYLLDSPSWQKILIALLIPITGISGHLFIHPLLSDRTNRLLNLALIILFLSAIFSLIILNPKAMLDDPITGMIEQLQLDSAAPAISDKAITPDYQFWRIVALGTLELSLSGLAMGALSKAWRTGYQPNPAYHRLKTEFDRQMLEVSEAQGLHSAISGLIDPHTLKALLSNEISKQRQRALIELKLLQRKQELLLNQLQLDSSITRKR